MSEASRALHITQQVPTLFSELCLVGVIGGDPLPPEQIQVCCHAARSKEERVSAEVAVKSMPHSYGGLPNSNSR